jgi:hypothetical protein
MTETGNTIFTILTNQDPLICASDSISMRYHRIAVSS